MRPRISISGCVRPSVCRSVMLLLNTQEKNVHGRNDVEKRKNHSLRFISPILSSPLGLVSRIVDSKSQTQELRKGRVFVESRDYEFMILL